MPSKKNDSLYFYTSLNMQSPKSLKAESKVKLKKDTTEQGD
uniref:Uncharacterized protein n=1 Tax=Anguilla anguilla TaxID=7936 RepID=A0A0E9QM48_ANGAN